MTETDRIKYLRIVLVAVGLVFIFGIWTLGLIWPSGWAWHAEGRSEYYEMILGLYATLGVFLIIAARNPRAHASLIWFRCGRAWSMARSWRCNRFPSRSTWGISGAMCWRSSPWRSSWRS